jgi:hypothetical protein
VQAVLLDVAANGCTDTKNYLPDYTPLLGGFGALLAGRLIGYARYDPRWAGWSQRRSTRVIGALALCVLLLGASLALIYEAIGVAAAGGPDKASLEPITYYVRCAIWHDKDANSGRAVLTFVVTALTGGLIGSWLWAAIPSRHVEDDAAPTALEARD